jgi:hypothetical protein
VRAQHEDGDGITSSTGGAHSSRHSWSKYTCGTCLLPRPPPLPLLPLPPPLLLLEHYGLPACHLSKLYCDAVTGACGLWTLTRPTCEATADVWASPQSHGPLMPTESCNLYLYLPLHHRLPACVGTCMHLHGQGCASDAAPTPPCSHSLMSVIEEGEHVG